VRNAPSRTRSQGQIAVVVKAFWSRQLHQDHPPRTVAVTEGEIASTSAEVRHREGRIVSVSCRRRTTSSMPCGKLAKVGPEDVVYDLGCGDGAWSSARSRGFNAKRGVGVRSRPALVKKSKDRRPRPALATR